MTPGTDAARLDAAYRAHRDGLFRLCYALLRNPDDAEDAVQEAFARASRAITADTRNPSAYLYMTARNVCRDLLRWRGRRDQRELTPDVATAATGPDDQAVALTALHKAWGVLSARERALLAHSFAGFDYQEIAGRVGLSSKGVSVGLVRARGKARRVCGGLAGALLGGLLGRGMWLRRRRESLRSTGEVALRLGASPTFGQLASVIVAGCLACGAGSAPVATAAVAARGATGAVAAVVPAGALVPPADGSVQVTSATPRAAVASGAPASGRGGHAAPAPDDHVLGVPVNDIRVESAAASPQYQSDHTIFAEGRQNSEVPVFYASSDGGQTWARRAATGFAGGNLALSPGWASDHRIFAGTLAGLQESDDGGATWSLLAPVPGQIAVAPLPAGGLRILIAGPALWTYDTASHTLARGPSLPLGLLPTNAIFAGDTEHALVGAVAAPGGDGLVLHCDLVVSCSTVLRLADVGGVRVVAPPGGPARTLAALAGGAVSISHDAGQTFTPVQAPAGEWASDVALASGASGPLAVVIWSRIEGMSDVEGVAAVDAGGSAAANLPTRLPAVGNPGVVLALPTGRILAFQQDGATVPEAWYSDNGGRTWTASAA